MDKIVLKDMVFHGFHGTKDFEKEIGQKIIISIELFLDLKKPGKTDDLKDTVDYQEIYKLINNIQARKKYNLLEALADTIADEVLKKGNVKKIFLQIKKPQVLIGGQLDYVAVEICREI
ncbi:MAG: dihydroneopterin aldolase [bacterium]|nr:dihydroneopterin aldolase [bacterium]